MNQFKIMSLFSKCNHFVEDLRMDQIVGITNTLYPGTKPLFKLAGGGGACLREKKDYFLRAIIYCHQLFFVSSIKLNCILIYCNLTLSVGINLQNNTPFSQIKSVYLTLRRY